MPLQSQLTSVGNVFSFSKKIRPVVHIYIEREVVELRKTEQFKCKFTTACVGVWTNTISLLITGISCHFKPWIYCLVYLLLKLHYLKFTGDHLKQGIDIKWMCIVCFFTYTQHLSYMCTHFLTDTFVAWVFISYSQITFHSSKCQRERQRNSLAC